MSSYKDTVFRYVPEGTGGTFSFSNDQIQDFPMPNAGLNHIDYIGTYGCYTCVGIYFKIDRSRACCMYVNGCSRVEFPKNLIADADGEAMKAEFLDRLRKEANEEEWDASNNSFGQNLAVICPNPDFECLDGEVCKRTGWYIVQGLREFFESEALKLEDNARTSEAIPTNIPTNHLRLRAESLYRLSQELSADREHQGFVIQHSTGKVTVFKVVDKSLSDNEIPEDFDEFVPRQEQSFKNMRERKWVIATLLGSHANKALAQTVVRKNNDLLGQDP